MIYRRYLPEDDAALNVLKLRAFSSGFERMRPDFWRWQYVENPAGRATGIVAVDAGRIAGFIGIVPRCMKVGEQIVLCAALVDYVVDPDSARGYIAAGLVRRAHALAAQDGCALSTGLTNANSFQITVHPRVGMAQLFAPAVALKPMRSFAPSTKRLQRFPLRLAALSATGCATWVSSYVNRARPSSRVTIRAVDRFEPDSDALWQRASRQLSVAFVRDAAYLEWRYLRHPIYRYQIFAAFGRGGLLGWVVVAERAHQGLRLGLIVDWLIDPAAAREATGPLLDAALQWARQRRVDALAAAFVPGMPFKRDLRSAGYFALPPRMSPLASRMVIRGLQPELDVRYADAAQWFWTWGDSDVG
jgi:hypothetical protein